MKNLTLIIPAKREAESLPQVLQEIKNVGCKIVQPLPEELYSGMHSMLSSSNALETVGKNLRSLILQKYTWKKTAEKYLSIADSICS